MKTVHHLLACFLLLGRIGLAAPKQHIVAFGKWTTVKWMVGENEHTVLDLKIRPLLVDGRSKEFTVGLPHDVTDHTFVVQRVFRLNDSLPQETVPERWHWERGGWLLVNRVSGKVQQAPLPEFRSLLFCGGLVSRLRSILRRLRGWQKNIRHHRAIGPAQTVAEKTGGGRSR